MLNLSKKSKTIYNAYALMWVVVIETLLQEAHGSLPPADQPPLVSPGRSDATTWSRPSALAPRF